MPNWLTVDFMMLNWQPLVVALVLGFILGWLFTGMPNARRARTAEERTAEVEARARRSERELTDVRVQGETSKTRLTNLQSDLDAANARITAFEEAAKDLATASLRQAEASGEAASDAEGETASAEAGEAGAAFPQPEGALPADEPMADDANGAHLSELEDAEAGGWQEEEADTDVAAPYVVAAVARAAEVHRSDMDGEDAELASADVDSTFRQVAQQVEPVNVPDNRDIALAEAYAHAATLQNELDKSDNALRMQQADIEALRAQVQVANAARHELETRLVRAREDVASELAVLASTMIKMKEDALTRADARIAALSNELEAVRNAASRSLELHDEPTTHDNDVEEMAAFDAPEREPAVNQFAAQATDEPAEHPVEQIAEESAEEPAEANRTA